MDFAWEKEQLELNEAIVNFSREIGKEVAVNDEKSNFSFSDWQKAAGFGLQGLIVPEEYGGTGIDYLTSMLAMEALGYGCTDGGFVFALANHIWVCESPIIRFGSKIQKSKYLPRLASGQSIGAYALTEPMTGSDAFNMSTRAIKQDDKYILNGTKAFITNAPIADVFIVFAITSEDDSKKISAFIVEKEFKGFSLGKDIHKMGLRTSPMSEIFLQDCEVPEENLLGNEHSGMLIANFALEMERSFIFACHVGAIDRILCRCVDYACKRKQFGSSIGKFQAVSNKIADMKVALEMSKLMLYKIGWLKKEGKRAFVESAVAKLFISENLLRTALDAVQIHGAYGYTKEFELERDLRDAISSTIYSGTSEIQRNIISNWLGL